MNRLISSEDVKALINGLDSLPFEEEVDDLVDRIPTASDVDREQAIKPLHNIYYPRGRMLHHVYCGKCGMYRQRVYLQDNYCRHCGTKIDWSETDGN